MLIDTHNMQIYFNGTATAEEIANIYLNCEKIGSVDLRCVGDEDDCCDYIMLNVSGIEINMIHEIIDCFYKSLDSIGDLKDIDLNNCDFPDLITCKNICRIIIDLEG